MKMVFLRIGAHPWGQGLATHYNVPTRFKLNYYHVSLLGLNIHKLSICFQFQFYLYIVVFIYLI